jgi:hypothetical protein
MALDPNIALSVRPLQFEMPNQLAQYAQISQIQNAQQANRLHEMQMAEYERARLEEEGTRNFLGRADLTDPAVRTQLLTGYGKTGREIYKNLSEAEKAQSEDSARRLKLMQDTQNMYRDMSGIISNKTDAAAFLQRVVNDPLMKDSPIAKIPLMQQVARIPEDPQGLDDWKKQFALGATKYITENKPHWVNAGGSNVPVSGLTGTALPGVPSIANTMTAFETGRLPIMQQTANAATSNAATNRGRLGVETSGLGLRALQTDPFNLTGAQAVFPLTAPSGVGGGGMGGGGGAPSVAGAPRAAAPNPTPANAPVADTISGRQMPLGQAINSGLTGPELLSVMPKSLAGQVNAILEHRAAPPSGNSARSSQLMQIVQAADPTYDAQQYKTKQGVETAFTIGVPSRTIKAINVADDHLKVLNSTIDALQNGNVKAFNQLGNTIASQFGSPAPTDFNGVKAIVADELVKAILGGAGALGDRKTIQDTINSAMDPDALRSMIKRYQQLMDGQRTGLAEQYKSGGGNSANVLSLLNKTKPTATQGTGGFTYLGKES